MLEQSFTNFFRKSSWDHCLRGQEVVELVVRGGDAIALVVKK